MCRENENKRRRVKGSVKTVRTDSPSSDLTPQEVRRATKGFCDFLYEVPKGRTFHLADLQGAVRVYNPTPSTYTFATHLKLAMDAILIEPVPNQPDVYRRISFKRSSYTYYAITTILKDRILAAFGELNRMLPPSARESQPEEASNV
jgi:hypothetical protein